MRLSADGSQVPIWAAMIIRQPPSIDHGLAETRKGRSRDRLWPRVQASAQAFYQKAAGLRADLFLATYEAFVESIMPQAPETYASWMSGLRKQFADVLLVDGSRLDAIAHQLKMLRAHRRVVLGGCVTAYYDLWRGIPRRIFFYADAAKAELTRALETLSWIPKGALLVGDRLYSASPKFFAALKDLHTLYASHPNLVGQQVYATAMVYTAFRIAQAKIAEKADVLPEQISPEKLFPKLAQAANDYCVAQLTVLKIKAMNPGVELKLPRYDVVVRSSQTRLRAILARPRRTAWRRPRFCPSRRRWTSLRRIPGGPSLLQSVHDG